MRNIIKTGYLPILVFLMLSGFQVRYGIIPAWKNINSDFPNYYTSSRLILEGRSLSNIYNDDWFQQEIYHHGINQLGKYSPYPPPTAFVMLPLAWLSPISAKRIFILFNIIVLLFAAFLISRISQFNYISSLNILLFSGAALSNNLMLGQFYLILLTLILLGYIQFLKTDNYSTGIILAIGAAVKYFPLIFIPAMLIKRKWKALNSMLGSFIIINVIACVILGMDTYLQFFRQVIFSHMNGELSRQSNYAISFQSWNSFLRNIFIYDRLENTSPLINSIAAFNITRTIVYLFFWAAAIIVLYRLRKSKDIAVYSIIVFSLLVFVLSPVSASYHLLLITFPVVLLLYMSKEDYPLYSLLFIVLYSLAGFSPVLLGKMNRATFGIFMMYERLWLVVVLFITAVKFISVHAKKEAIEPLYFRSTIPKADSSFIES